MVVLPELEKYSEKIVEVKFLDHVSSGEPEQDLALCTVWGRLVLCDPQKIRVRVWEANDDHPDEDAEFITLIRAAVVSVRSLIFGDGQ